MDKLTLREFADALAKEIEVKMTSEHGVTVDTQVHQILKTNGERTGITVRVNDNCVAPTLYAEDAYKLYTAGERSMDSLASEMAGMAYMASIDGPDVPHFTAEEAREHITLTVMNTAMNAERLKDVPHYSFAGGELSAVPRWYISDEASFIVTNQLASSMGLTPDEVLQIGKKNLDQEHFKVKSMQDTLIEMMGPEMAEMMPPVPDDSPQMIVITSENRIQGSRALLSDETLDRVHDMIGDYVILPSSLHEVIAVSITDDMSPDTMRDMVRDVNQSQVAVDERLSDQVFMYDGNKLSLVGESFTIDTSDMEPMAMSGPSFSMA